MATPNQRRWINCNKCQSTDASLCIYISSCGHLVCSHCLNPSTHNRQSLQATCPICSLDTLFILITQTDVIPEEVERIIADPSRHILESIDIVNLQTENYERVVEGLGVKLQKYKKILEKLKDYSNEAQSRNTQLTQENTQLRNQLARFASSLLALTARIDPNMNHITAPMTPTRLSIPQNLSTHSTPSTARSMPRVQQQQQGQYTKPYARPYTQSTQSPRNQYTQQAERAYQPPRTSPANQGYTRQPAYQQPSASQGRFEQQSNSRQELQTRASTSYGGRIPSMPLPSTPRMRDTWSAMRR